MLLIEYSMSKYTLILGSFENNSNSNKNRWNAINLHKPILAFGIGPPDYYGYDIKIYCIRRSIFRYINYFKYYFFSLLIFLRNHKDIDQVIAQDPPRGLHILILIKIFSSKIKYFVELHGDAYNVVKYYHFRKSLFYFVENILNKIIFLYTIKNSDKVRLISHSHSSLIPKKYKNKIVVFPAFTDLSGKLKHLEQINQIIFVGSLIPLKNVKILIEAFSIIKMKFIDLNLVLVGDGELLKSLQDLAKSYSLEASVQFKGRLPHDQVLEEIERSRFLVLPSITEGVSLAILEAMSLGKPVIASDVGGTPSVVKHLVSGILFKSNDVQDLVRSLELLLTDRKLEESIGENAKLCVNKKYSFENYIRNYKKYLDLNV
jgi:glycosyltransferase involved in cell wall biosynthesis